MAGFERFTAWNEGMKKRHSEYEKILDRDAVAQDCKLHEVPGATAVLLDQRGVHAELPREAGIVPTVTMKTCVAYGDWSKRGGIKGHAISPVKGLARALQKRATDEFITSKLCSQCQQEAAEEEEAQGWSSSGQDGSGWGSRGNAQEMLRSAPLRLRKVQRQVLGPRRECGCWRGKRQMEACKQKWCSPRNKPEHCVSGNPGESRLVHALSIVNPPNLIRTCAGYGATAELAQRAYFSIGVETAFRI